MLGIMRRAQVERDDRERAARRRAWRRKIAHRYNVTAFECAMPAADGSHRRGAEAIDTVSDDEFCLQVLAHLAADQVPRALVDLRHTVSVRKRRTLRCWIFGCSARGRCELQPYCTDCQGRCERCGKPVVAKATARNE